MPKIDWSTVTWSDVIQNLSAIGTFVAALVAFWTVRILIRQRKDSFRPKVLVMNPSWGYCSAKADNILKTEWHTGDVGFPYVGFEVVNAGNGIAEDLIISIKWDVSKAIKFIKDRDKNKEFLITRNGDGLRIATTFDQTTSWLPITDKRRLGSLLTIVQNSNKPNGYVFSDHYLALLSCVDYLTERYDKFMSLKDFPKMIYEVVYSDIEGSNYKATFEQSVIAIRPGLYSFTIVKV